MTNPTHLQPTEGRTAQLLEQLLQIARVSALEEMASGMAHELNQPIGAIATFAQAAQRMLDRPDPMVRSVVDVLQHISHEALNAGQGIRRIRSLFNGHGEGRAVCELADVIGELTPVLELLARRRGGTLRLTVQGELPRVMIDRLRIQHVLFTLVQNAFEAPTRDDEPSTVEMSVTGDRYGIEIAVEDRGIGIDETVRKQLFHPFFTTKVHGTGLGLASSRAIAEAHEGSIAFENTQDGGTRFLLRLPAVPQQQEGTTE
jgi:two-component system sensor kinase FixL